MRAVALLSLWKTRNALRTLFTDPRKFVPAILFFLCIGCSFGSSLLGLHRPSQRGAFGAIHPDPALFQGCIFLAAVLMCIGAVDSGLGDSLLAFGMADVDYLFPSPISRKTVLAYRLPALTFGALLSMVFFLYLYTVALNVFDFQFPNRGTDSPPWFLGPGCMALCFASYLNLAMFAAIRVKNRAVLHRVVLGVFVCGIAALVATGYFLGVPALLPIAKSPILHVAFFPCYWASQGLEAQAMRTADMTPLYLLCLTYAASLIPMFAVNVNYYEQSIVSSERVAAVRKAAKSGFAAQQASRAERFKYKARREYSVKPFGHGATAVVWAHLCAAVKRPYANVVLPVGAGLACGAFAFLANNGLRHSGVGVICFFAFYSSMGFLGSARTASEAAVRRRDLVDPLPIPAWQAVMANLAVPWGVMFSFCVSAGVAYSALGSEQWPMVLFGLCVLFPLALGAGMVLQYVLVLGYPDFSDKVQQLLAMGVFYLLTAPLAMVDAIFLIPALLLHSVWLGLVLLSLLQIGFLVFFVWIAGIASAKAVATGEPVSLFRVFAKT